MTDKLQTLQDEKDELYESLYMKIEQGQCTDSFVDSINEKILEVKEKINHLISTFIT